MQTIFNRVAIALNFGLLGAVAIFDIQALYYLKVFIDKYHLPPNYLSIVQILFLVWNALNDPIMGYMQDLGCCGIKWIMDRRKVMLYAGPAFAASFLLFWFPWSTSNAVVTAIHLLVSLFLFDTLLTLVFSAYCGLCVELSHKHSDRVLVIIYAEIFSLLAGFFVFPIETLTHNLDYYSTFQWCTIIIALIGIVCMVFCGLSLKKEKAKNGEDKEMTEDEEMPNNVKKAITISWGIIKEFRFICLVGAQFFKILRFMGNEQFLIIYVETLLVQTGYLQKGDKFLGIYYVLVRSLGSVSRIVQRKSPIVSLAFSSLSRCGWQGYYIVIAGEVIDTDKKQNSRRAPLSTIIFTLKALFNKPADQLAPIILLTLLEYGGYTTYKNGCGSFYETDTSTQLITTYVICENSYNMENYVNRSSSPWINFIEEE
uniref:MFS domain-containing protein n=1 Tax=Heterorhabditis bacteriophora TaxID=37862 RepID=A0A1I7XB30_HETBA